MLKNKSYFLPLIGILFGLAGLLAGLYLFTGAPDKDDLTDGNVVLGGDFVLQSADGPVSLSAYRGKVVVLYFGYAFCPDVCPTSLGLLSLALGKMKAEELKKIQAFFISVDPERDTLAQLKIYASAFHPNITGITGTEDEITDVAKRYTAIYAKVDLPGSALGYAIDHSSRYSVIGYDGKLNGFIEHGASPDEIVAILRSVM